MSYPEEMKRFDAELERRLAAKQVLKEEVELVRRQLASNPSYLSEQLLEHLGQARLDLRAWRRALDEVRKNKYDHKEDGTEQMVIKYTMIELQALCGLASLVSKKVTETSTG